MFVSESYVVEDCYVYDSTTYTGTSLKVETLNYTLPSNTDYLIEYEDYLTSRKNCILRIGTDGNNFVAAGIMNSNTTYRLWTYNNKTYIEQLTTNHSEVLNSWQSHQVTVENNSLSFYDKTATSSRTFNLTYLVALVLESSSIRKIKIKPL